MSAKYKSPSFLLPNELNTSANPANDTGVNSLYSMDFPLTSYINLGATSDFDFNTSNFSISLWMKKDGNSGSYQPLVDLGGYSQSPYNQGTSIYSNTSNQIHIYNRGSSPSNWLTSITTTTGWNHIVVVRNGDNLTVYINNTSSQVNQNFTGVSSINFGGSLLSRIAGANSWSGKIDEVAIFNRVLNTTEISALYDGTGSNIRPSNLMATDLNPIAYYPLGEQAQNTGYLDPNNPGSDISGSEWQFPNGVLQDYVMDFNGTNYISSPLNNVFNSATQSTISFWAKKSSSSNEIVLGAGTAETNSIYILWYSNSYVYFGTRATGATAFNINYVFSGSDKLNKWHHFMGVYNAGTASLYINGSLVSGPTSGGPSSLGSDIDSTFAIGRLGDVTTYNSTGEMSNVAIWNTAITDANQIANIYNNGSPQTSYTVSPQNWWKLNADSVFAPSAPNYTTALDFTSPDLISINSPITIDTTQPYSISAWVYLDSTGTEVIIAGNTSGGTSNFVVPLVIKSVSGSFAAIATHQENSSGVFRQSNSIAKSELTSGWSHIVLVKDGVNCSFFYNGQPYGTASFSTTPPATVELTTIGKGFNNWYLNGRLSNLAIFDSGLTASQISTLFNFGTPETNISFSPQAWWKLNDQTAITDSSGNGNTGTNNGAANFPSGIAVTPVWKIPNALPIPTINTTSALDFTSGNKISLNPKFNFDLTSVNTISVWVNLKSYSAFNSILTNNGTGGGSTGTYTQLLILTTGSVNNTFAFYTYKQGFSNPTANSGWRSNDIPKQEFENSWHHVMLVRDGQDVSWYYDGQPWGGGTITTTQTENVDVNCIGQGNASSGGLYGEISNLAIWNSDQSSNVSNIYNSGQPQSSYTVTPNHLFKLDNLTTGINDVYSSSAGTATSGVTKVDTNVYVGNIPVNGVSTTLPSTALQQSDLQFDSPYSNYSLSFDGTGDYIDCTDISYFSGADRFTLSTWFKVDSSDDGVNNRDIISKGSLTTGTTSFFIRKGKNTNLNKISVSFDEGSTNVSSTTQIQNDVWYHVAIVYKGYESNNADRAKIYINGVDDTASYTNTVPTTLVSSTQPLRIGRWASGTDFFGKIDETAIWQSVLTDAQILQVYNNGRPSDITSLSPNYWWRLGENAYFQDSTLVLPNSITGAPNGNAATNNLEMISADAPGTYANGIGTNLDILDRVGDAPLSTSNSQSYNMIPSDISPYVPQYVGDQISNTYSMLFDAASSSYFDTNQSLSSSYSALTLSAWVNYTTLTSLNGTIFGQWIQNNNSGSTLLCYTASSRIQVYLGPSATSLTSTTTLTTGAWYNVVLSFNGSTMKLYINGTEEASAAFTAINNSAQNLILGAYSNNAQNGYQGYLDGKLDEVAIFDTALNAGQIYNDIYQPTSTATNKTADFVNNPNLPNPVAWYRMGD